MRVDMNPTRITKVSEYMNKSPSVNQTLNPLVLLSREFSLFENRTEI